MPCTVCTEYIAVSIFDMINAVYPDKPVIFVSGLHLGRSSSYFMHRFVILSLKLDKISDIWNSVFT